MCMWKIGDIIENIHLGSKFKYGMFICTKTEIDNQPIVIYVDVNGKHVTIDTEPLLLSSTDDMYNSLKNGLKGLKGFKIDIKTKRTRTGKKNNDDDTNIIENNVDNETTTKTKTKTSTKTKRGRRGRKKKSKSKSE